MTSEEHYERATWLVSNLPPEDEYHWESGYTRAETLQAAQIHAQLAMWSIAHGMAASAQELIAQQQPEQQPEAQS